MRCASLRPTRDSASSLCVPLLALLRVEVTLFTPVGTAMKRTWPALVSVALFLASRRTGVTRYPALWSGDFPHSVHTAKVWKLRGCLVYSAVASIARQSDPHNRHWLGIGIVWRPGDGSLFAVQGCRQVLGNRKNRAIQSTQPARIPALAVVTIPSTPAVLLPLSRECCGSQ